MDEYLPVCNEGLFDAEITIPADTNPKFPLLRDYKIHIQGIIDRLDYFQDLHVDTLWITPLLHHNGQYHGYCTTDLTNVDLTKYNISFAFC